MAADGAPPGPFCPHSPSGSCCPQSLQDNQANCLLDSSPPGRRAPHAPGLQARLQWEAGGRGWAMSHFSTSGQSRLADSTEEVGKQNDPHLD